MGLCGVSARLERGRRDPGHIWVPWAVKDTRDPQDARSGEGVRDTALTVRDTCDGM